MDIVTQIQTFVSENTLASVVIGLLLAVILGLIVVVINQNRKYQVATAPKYGFLGKPIYSFFAFAFIVGGLGFALIANNQEGSPDDALAGITLTVSIDAAVINPTTKDYQFRVTPVANDVQWGPYSYDAYWTFTNADGTITTSVETGLTRNNIGGIIRKLPSGINKIKVNVFVEDRNLVKEIEVTVP